MSFGFHQHFFNLAKMLYKENNYALVLNNVVWGSLLHFGYVCSTYRDNQMIVKSKYQFTEKGFTKFMLIDNDNKHYCVNNSVWFWKWDSVEDWNKVKVNDFIEIKCYGYRIPIFSLFPNIYNIEFLGTRERYCL